VQAWDIPLQPDPRSVDLPRYRTLLERAVQTVLDPIEQAAQPPAGLGAQWPLFENLPVP
jgi:hypothetical protein